MAVGCTACVDRRASPSCRSADSGATGSADGTADSSAGREILAVEMGGSSVACCRVSFGSTGIGNRDAVTKEGEEGVSSASASKRISFSGFGWEKGCGSTDFVGVVSGSVEREGVLDGRLEVGGDGVVDRGGIARWRGAGPGSASTSGDAIAGGGAGGRAGIRLPGLGNGGRGGIIRDVAGAASVSWARFGSGAAETGAAGTRVEAGSATGVSGADVHPSGSTSEAGGRSNRVPRRGCTPTVSARLREIRWCRKSLIVLPGQGTSAAAGRSGPGCRPPASHRPKPGGGPP